MPSTLRYLLSGAFWFRVWKKHFLSEDKPPPKKNLGFSKSKLDFKSAKLYKVKKKKTTHQHKPPWHHPPKKLLGNTWMHTTLLHRLPHRSSRETRTVNISVKCHNDIIKTNEAQTHSTVVTAHFWGGIWCCCARYQYLQDHHFKNTLVFSTHSC